MSNGRKMTETFNSITKTKKKIVSVRHLYYLDHLTKKVSTSL